MTTYLLRRLLLIPITLVCILLINFMIINMAPGDPSTLSSVGEKADGAMDASRGIQFDRDEQYLLFREHYGLTLPVLFNLWPNTRLKTVKASLEKIASKEANKVFRIRFGDRSRYLMPTLLSIAEDPSEAEEVRQAATRFFIRAGTHTGFVGPSLSLEERALNRKVAADNLFLRTHADDLSALRKWYGEPSLPGLWEKARIFFADTRLSRYFRRVLTLDFGTIRNDANRSVIREVGSRMKYSLTLAVLPMAITFILCQVVGFTMAIYQNRWPDFLLNIALLLLYAIPIFVVAPFLIEKIALPHDLPFSGFHSPPSQYVELTSNRRIMDIAYHIFLPLIAIMYGTLAVQSRVTRTAVLEVMRQDYVRTAHAKGLPRFKIYWKHIGRNAAITIVTSLTASLGVILGGSLIIETIFSIDGFGRFFYEAIVNRDYNVIMFCSLAGAVLTLVGYLLADLSYTLLDPRVSLE